MNIQITETRLSDIASLRDCIAAVARECAFLASDKAPSAEALANDVKSCSIAGSIHLVAMDDQQVVGWARIERAESLFVTHRGDLDMGVLAAYRGRGIARQLLERAISIANGRGIHRIELEVRSDNRRALELYSSTGFAVESIVGGAMKVDGIFHDAFRMCLVIVPPSEGLRRAA